MNNSPLERGFRRGTVADDLKGQCKIFLNAFGPPKGSSDG